MAAYVISDVEPLDAALIAQYRTLAEASIAKFGGRYVARVSRGLHRVTTPVAVVR